ncbi:hypothetical protein PITCH_A2030124 [uncultured Desulfobacterium sp.]|uniref:Uncharacterized protein n=1 Tax=uncultured Desulfobacterium sp. TaxID=201089 RepID=A0A445MWX1_9BACT|nr:hypothetical protein PITCH_A2030124 [uncultured Desulfobacterium sp.]
MRSSLQINYSASLKKDLSNEDNISADFIWRALAGGVYYEKIIRGQDTDLSRTGLVCGIVRQEQ